MNTDPEGAWFVTTGKDNDQADDRRAEERRKRDLPIDGAERRKADRRSGDDRRKNSRS